MIIFNEIKSDFNFHLKKCKSITILQKDIKLWDIKTLKGNNTVKNCIRDGQKWVEKTIQIMYLKESSEW